MKTPLLLTGWLTVAGALCAAPPNAPTPAPPIAPPPPPPVYLAPAAPAGPVSLEARVVTNTVLVTNAVVVTNTVLVPRPLPPEQYVYEQRPMAGRPVLVSPEQAKAVIERFKTNYAQLGSPRLLIFVNRELDEHKALTLTDKQTVRDVERLFGRPLRLGGATLVDQRIANQVLGDQPFKTIAGAATNEVARKERETLGKLADVAIEVLISSRNVTVPGLSGDSAYAVPDIQATAIRLTDAKILGQATAADLLGKDSNASRMARFFDVRDITEATALSLMEDMMLGAGQ